MRTLKPFLLGWSLLALVLPGIAQADAVAEFYKGKTVTVYVGYGAGGGYDAYGRVLAQHIGDHIPSNPTVIVQNMPGAASARLANFLYGAAPRDGTAFGIIDAQLAFGPLFGGMRAEGLRFDAREFNWIGSLDQFTPIGIAWHETGIKSLDDAKAREISVGSSGAVSTTAIYSRLLNTMLGTRFRPIHGYRGSRDISLALEQGEVETFIGWCWACMKADRPEWIRENRVHTFLQLGIERDPEIPDVPYIFDLLENPEDRQVWQLVLSELAMARPFVAPPEVPDERVAALRAAFEAMVVDPAFLAIAAKANRDIKPFTGAQIDTLLEETYALPKSVIERAAAVFKE